MGSLFKVSIFIDDIFGIKMLEIWVKSCCLVKE